MNIEKLISEHCYKHPAAIAPIAEVVRLFRQTQPLLTRSQIVAALAEAGYPFGRKDDRLHYVAGIGLNTPWVARDGRLLQIA